jgi:glycerol uptake facilitator-like aquaporin
MNSLQEKMPKIAKIFLAELVGTFVFLSIILTTVKEGASTQKKGAADLGWLRIGLGLSAAILLVGFISGGHLNPSVSFVFFLNNQLSFSNMIIYIIAQFIGAYLACLWAGR